MPAWPVTLPQTLIIDGLEHSAQPSTIRNQPDTGPALVRKRFTAAVEFWQGYMWMTYAQYLDAVDFFNNDLSGGVLEFDFVHPITGATVSARLITNEGRSMVIAGTSGNLLRIQLQIEMLP